MTTDPGPLLSSMPFSLAVGMEIEAASADEVTGRLAWSADRCTIGGALHGGALMSLADRCRSRPASASPATSCATR